MLFLASTRWWNDASKSHIIRSNHDHRQTNNNKKIIKRRRQVMAWNNHGQGFNYIPPPTHPKIFSWRNQKSNKSLHLKSSYSQLTAAFLHSFPHWKPGSSISYPCWTSSNITKLLFLNWIHSLLNYLLKLHSSKNQTCHFIHWNELQRQ